MSDTRSYMMVIKDLESDQEVILTVVDWSEAEKSEAVRQVLRRRGVPDHVNFRMAARSRNERRFGCRS